MQTAIGTNKRIHSIDILRGIVMVIMVLDHTRDFFHISANTSNPLDPATTTPWLYFTRWITHFCAPVFVLLSGTSIYLQSLRKSPSELSRFLLTRGCWLIVAEVGIVTLGISFNPFYNMLMLQVIWAIGISMVLMAGIVRLPFKWIAALGFFILFAHNLLDIPESKPGFHSGFWWSLLHSNQNPVHPFAPGHYLLILYPFIPWLGLMLVGYALGKLFHPSVDAQYRQRLLVLIGCFAIGLFLALRSTNLYGDPLRWEAQSSAWRTILSFFNVQKYPPSLLYSCITIGPALILLAQLEKMQNRFTHVMEIYGRTAFFYYLVHFYLLHLLAAIIFFAKGKTMDMAIQSAQQLPFLFIVPGEGFSLPVVYGIWLSVVIALYPLCKKYNQYKTNHPNKKWLSYL